LSFDEVMPDKRTTPNDALIDLLLLALSPCDGFSNSCNRYVRWDPQQGHIPRGYIGGTGTIVDIRLILVTAEPGDPADGETYIGSPRDMVLQYSARAYTALESLNLRRGGRPAPFHKNLRLLIDLCWSEMTFPEQMRRTWITPAVLCSAPVSGGSVPRAVSERCAASYLRPQIDALPAAFVIALGSKAAERLRLCGARCDFVAQHPSARPNTKPLDSWREAAEAFNASLRGSFI
jgi:hypothetical protein